MNRLLKPLTATLALAMMVLVTTSAFAFTHYPNATCPDTLTIKQLKDRLNVVGPCNPMDASPATTPGDTIYGTGGIVIGSDANPTGFDTYIQMTGGGPNTGIDVFTHGTPFVYNRGDSIVVEFGAVANFQGDIELMGPNNNFSNPDIIIRKVSSGNPLPPFFVGNTTDLNELPTNATFAPYVSALVHLTGPVRVARVGGALGARSMLVVRDAATSDSVFIDYGKLTSIIPPVVGTIITSIQGIGNKATRGFRIMPRDANDVVDNVPPGVTDAYAVADNQYRVVFDRPVTSASATSTGNYTLGSFGNVDAAVMDGPDAAVLTVSGTGLSHGQSESVQINGVVGLANGQSMTTPQSRTFLAGVMSCGEITQPNPDTLATGSGGLPCVDKPLYSGSGGQFLSQGGIGPRSTMTGIVVAQFGNLSYMEDGTPDPAVNQHFSRGITAFAPPAPLVIGRRYLIAGGVQNFWAETELTAITYVKDLGAAAVPPPWTSLTPDVWALGDFCDATQTVLTARDYMSTLVRFTNLKVVPKQLAPNTPSVRFSTNNNVFFAVGPSPTNNDTLIIENQNNVLGPYSASNPNYPALYTHIDVTGVVHFTNNPAFPNSANIARTFRLCPRTAADLAVVVGVGDQDAPTLSFAVYPNPAKTVNIAFSLSKESEVDLAVYDLLGRKVAQIAKGTYSAGTHQKAWNATNSTGGHVGPGIYFYRLRAGEDVRTARTLLLGR